MAAAEEIDLKGLDEQINSVSKGLEKLNRNLYTSEKELDDIANKNSSMYVKALKDSINQMSESVGIMSSKLKDGKDGVNDFINAMRNFTANIDKIKAIGGIPMTGILENLGKMKDIMSSVFDTYKSVYAYEEKLIEANRKRLDILNGVVDITLMQQEKNLRAIENEQALERIREKASEKEKEAAREAAESAERQRVANQKRLDILNGVAEVTEVQRKKEERENVLREERAKRDAENKKAEARLEEVRQKAWEKANQTYERGLKRIEDADRRRAKMQEESSKREKENAEYQAAHVENIEKSLELSRQRVNVLEEEYDAIVRNNEEQLKELDMLIEQTRIKKQESISNIANIQRNSTSDSELSQAKYEEEIVEYLQKQIEEYERKKIKIEAVISSVKNELDENRLVQESLQSQIDLINAAKEEEIKRFSQEQKINDAKNAEAKIQAEIERLVSQGSKKGIRMYLEQLTNAERLKKVIGDLVALKEKFDTSTENGNKNLKEVNDMIMFLKQELNGTSAVTERINSLFGNTKNLASQIAMSFGVMTGVFGATNFVKSLYKITSEFQLQQKALGAIINNAREANILFRQMQTLAVNSPLKFMDLNKYAKQLAAYRIETNKLYDSLKMLGDISVGVGVDMDRLILAYGQVKAANYLRGQELRQFSEAGVNILGGLRDFYYETKNINMSINDIFDSVSKRKVLFEDVEAVLKRMTQSGGTFYNMQMIQSQTLYGQIRKLSDMYQIEMNKIGSSTSGVLLGLVKIMQLALKNLNNIISATVTIGASVGLYKFVNYFKAMKAAAEGTGKELKGLLKVIDIFSTRGIRGFKQVNKYILSSLKNINLMKLGIAALGGAVAFGVSKIVQHFQEEKEAAKETAEELVELNRRLAAIRKVEAKFNKDNTYDKRLASLQELVEKAKEFNYFMSIPKNINEGNVDDVFKTLSENLKNYVNDVQHYTAAFSNKGIDRRISRFGNMFPDFVMYSEQAKQALDFIENNLGELDAYQKKTYDDIRQMQKDFLEDEVAAVHKYGITTDMLDREIAKRTKTLLQSLTTNKFFFGKLREMFDNDKFFSDFFNFFDKYDKRIDRIEKKIKKKAKGINWNMFAGIEGDELKQKIEKVFPAILEQFKDQAEFFGPEAAAAFARMFKIDEGLVVPVLFDFKQGTTDLNDEEWKKRYREIVEQSGLEYDKKEKAFVLETKVKTEVKSLSGEYHNVVKDSKQTLTNLTISAETSKEEFQKILDESIKDFKAKAEEYKQVKNNIIDFDLKNKLVGINFANPEAAISYYETLAEKYTEIYEKGFGKLPDKTTSTSRQSMKSEYQDMIDFIRELNREFDKLRKNFNEDDSGKWAGAINRILSSFEAKFGEMPVKFKNAFKDSLNTIDFTTKEGTIAAEGIVKGLIDSAKDLTPKEKRDLGIAWGEAIGQIKLETELTLKKEEDERLKAQVQKMFDDYTLTVELDKLGVDVTEVGHLFNIDVKDLNTLEAKLEAMKEKFVGQDMEKEWRQFMRRIVEINDKANLEMAKKYVKYLHEEFDERAKIELEYMKKRAEVYALPFDANEQARILENMRKETEKKLDEVDWKTFQGTDSYIEMFQDLGKVSNEALSAMIDKLKEMQKSMHLSATDMKTMAEQIEKIEDEFIKRNPFTQMAKSIKALKAFRTDENIKNLINQTLGTEGDIKNFMRTFNKAVEEAQRKVDEATKKRDNLSVILGAAKTREQAKNANIFGIDWEETYDIDELKRVVNSLSELRKKANEEINASERDTEKRTEAEKRYTIYDNQIKSLSAYISALEKLKEAGLEEFNMPLEDIEKVLKEANGDLEEFKRRLIELQEGKKIFVDLQKAIIEAANQIGEAAQKSKEAFSAMYEYMESIGVSTDVVTEAWKDFGEQMFETIIRATQMIPAMVTQIVAAETAINAAAGWIGIIAEAITLVVTGLTALARLQDSYKEKEIQNLQKNLDRLKKTAEGLSETFEKIYDEDQLRQFDAALINTRELYINSLEMMIDAEEAKKKTDETAIQGWKDEIESTQKEIQDGIDKFYESLGGFGGTAGMKSAVEEWADAWYEAFKETGDGLSGLEDSFEQFLENMLKRTLVNTIMSKYFSEEFLSQLNSIIGREGGVMGNLDAINEWINQYHELAYQADEEMTAAANAISGITGIGAGLEGLQASLQGMTEDTAESLVGYLNSLRYYVADNNELIRNLQYSLTVDNNTNPIIEQLKIIAVQATSINMLLDSVVRAGYQGNGGGNYIKVQAVIEP